MDASAIFFGYLISGLIFGLICMAIASGRGMSGGFLWGFFLGIIGVIIVAVRPNDQTSSSMSTSSISVPDESNIVYPTTVYRFVCRSCGKKSTGWYQKCPNCGAVGKMEKLPQAEVFVDNSSLLIDTDKRKREEDILANGGWRCNNCGKVNFGYTYGCDCGAKKGDPALPRQLKSAEEIIENTSATVEETVVPTKEFNAVHTKNEKRDWHAIHEELRSWKQLLDEDIITQEEFDEKKKELLKQSNNA